MASQRLHLLQKQLQRYRYRMMQRTPFQEHRRAVRGKAAQAEEVAEDHHPELKEVAAVEHHHQDHRQQEDKCHKEDFNLDTWLRVWIRSCWSDP